MQYPPRHRFIALVLIAAGLAAAAPALRAQAAGAGSAPLAGAATRVPVRVPVVTARIDSLWLQPEREAPAVVVPRNQSRLAAEVAGVVQRWTVDVGARVERGQILAQVDPRDAELSRERARAALQAVQARLDLAQLQLKRARELVAQGFFSQEALAQRETEAALLRSEVAAQRAALALAQRQLDKTTLKAPFAGSITERLAQTGESVAPGSVLYVLTETGAPEVDATISPADLPGLRGAAGPRFEHANGSHGLELLRIGSTVEVPARTRSARLGFAEPGRAPPPGTSGSLRWIERQPHVPPDLIQRRNGRLGIFVRQGDGAAATARFVPLPGAQEGRASALPDGIEAGTPVIVGGQGGLQHGQAIEVSVGR